MNRSVPSNKKIIEKLIKEGKPYINDLEDALLFNNSKLNSFNNKSISLYKNKSKTNGIPNYNGINYTEAMKFINNFNQKMTTSISSYNQKRMENNNFKNAFKKIKNIKKNLPSIEQEKLNYIYGNLIKRYEQKGIIINKEFFNKDIYKGCGLLMINNDIDKFYKYDFNSDEQAKNKRAKKNIDFLTKINKQAQLLYNKKLLESKKLEEEEQVIYFNSANKEQMNASLPVEEKPEIRIKRHNLNTFVNKVNIIIKEIKEEKDEIKKLKKLILAEEKSISLQRKKYQDENFRNMLNEESNDLSKRKERKIKTINPIMAFNFGKKNKNEKKLNSEESKLITTMDNINKENNNTSKSNNLNTHKNIHSESTTITQNNLLDRKKNFFNNIFNQLSLSNIMRKRLSSMNIFNNDSNKSKSLNSLKSVLINLKKKRRVSLKIPHLKKSLTVSDTYEQLANLDFISYKKNTKKKRETINSLLKKYYGKKYQDYNGKNNHIKILNNYMRMKDEIIKSEKENDLFRYKDDLPQATKNKIDTNLKQNEKIKNYGNIYIQTFYGKKLKD